MATDQELVDTLDELWRSIEEFGRELDEADWKRPTECPGWTVQDNLVHLTALERFILGDPLPSEDVPDDLPHVKNDDRQGERAMDRVAPRLDRCRRARRVPRRARVLASISCARSSRPISMPTRGLRWAPAPCVTSSRSASSIRGCTVRTCAGRVDRSGDLDSAAADQSLGMMVGVLPYVIGKKVGAPDGSTVVLVLTGPLARTVVIEVAGGRARVLDTVPESPTVVLTLASDAYARLACGRTDPGEALAVGGVAIDGDAELGGKIVHQLNYMF